MRTLFFVLALANALFFAYAWFTSGAQAGGDAQIIHQQLNPEKIRLLQPAQASALMRAAEPPKAAAVCLEWGAFTGADVARAQQALEPLALGAKLTQRTQQDVSGYWVYMPPLGSRKAAAQKASELKHLGVQDYFIVSDDTKWHDAISLGVFKTEDAAKARLEVLRAKGVRTAIVGAHETTVKTYFEVHDADPTVVAKLNQIKQGFSGSELHACPADGKKG
jgi:SPOR domain